MLSISSKVVDFAPKDLAAVAAAGLNGFAEAKAEKALDVEKAIDEADGFVPDTVKDEDVDDGANTEGVGVSELERLGSEDAEDEEAPKTCEDEGAVEVTNGDEEAAKDKKPDNLGGRRDVIGSGSGSVEDWVGTTLLVCSWSCTKGQ